MSTPFVIETVKAGAIVNGPHKRLVAAQQRKAMLDAQLSQAAINVNSSASELRTLQVQILAGVQNPPVVTDQTPIAMVLNNDGTVTLNVG